MAGGELDAWQSFQDGIGVVHFFGLLPSSVDDHERFAKEALYIIKKLLKGGEKLFASKTALTNVSGDMVSRGCASGDGYSRNAFALPAHSLSSWLDPFML